MSEQEVFDALKYRIEVDTCGTRCYYNNAGELHRDDGPAVEYADGLKYWYQNGQLHRTDGPAVVFEDGDNYWYINGKRMTEAEFLAATQPVVELSVADIEKLVGKRVKIVK
jgi:hypothetical protein